MKVKVKVTWDFDDTEFEYLQYGEALESTNLKRSYTIKDYNEEEVDIESYLIEVGNGIMPETWTYTILGD